MSNVEFTLTGSLYERATGDLKLIVDRAFGIQEYLDDNGNNMVIEKRADHTLVGFGLLRSLAERGFITLHEDSREVDVDRVNEIFSDFCKLDPSLSIRDYQPRCVIKALNRKRGMISAAPGAGKTEMISALVTYIRGKILVSNNRSKILSQLKARFIKRGIPANEIALFGEKGWHTKRVIIGGTTAINNRIKKQDPETIKFLGELEALIFDEAHHAGAATWVTIAANCQPDYLLHFTGTPWEKPKDPLSNPGDAHLWGITGGVIIHISSVFLRKKGYLAHPLVHFLDYENTEGWLRSFDWKKVERKYIVNAYGRLDRMCLLLEILNHFQVKTLVIVSMIDHGYNIMSALRALDVNVSFSMGGGKVAYIDPLSGHVESRPCTETFDKEYFRDNNILIGSSIYDEGTDIPVLECGVMAGGGKGVRRSIQRIGRVIRAKPDPDKNFGFWFDFNDVFNNITKRHSEERRSIYEDESYQIYDSFDELLAMIKYVKGI